MYRECLITERIDTQSLFIMMHARVPAVRSARSACAAHGGSLRVCAARSNAAMVRTSLRAALHNGTTLRS